MTILFIDTYYQNFLNSFWQSHQKLKNEKYSNQINTLLNQCFGTSDYYSYNLKELGYQTYDIIANDEVSQKQWAYEHKINFLMNEAIDKLRSFPYATRYLGKPSWIQKIVLSQIEFYQPDVIYIQDLSILTSKTLQKIKEKGVYIFGQIACPISDNVSLDLYDLILTSFPHYVKKFRKMGIKSEYFKIGFETRLLEKIQKTNRKYDVTFIGSFSPHHQEATKILENVAKKIPIHVWGHGLQYLDKNSPLRNNYHGEAWGLDMYKILSQSKIILNRHIDAAENNANNMRLYESTGMGAMLLTDHRKNLNQLFRVGKEIVSYHNENDLIKKIIYYLKNPKEREQVSLAGQKRTLKDHTYKKRMKELDMIIDKHL
jgi:spore maturation protein CgeB